MKPRILIIGPIENFGGRELEAGFIASVLRQDYQVDVVSTGNFIYKSQFYDLAQGIKVTSLKELLYRKFKSLRGATFLSYLRNKKKEPVYYYINNRINARFLKRKEIRILTELIQNCDLVFVIAHLQTLRTKEIIQISKELVKPVVFRTTGEIETGQESSKYLNGVDLFIHHSHLNAAKLHSSSKMQNFMVIDQNSYLESDLLAIPIVPAKVRSFVTVARLAPEKNLENLVIYFKECSEPEDFLTIVGTGILYSKLFAITKEVKNIELLGHVSMDKLAGIYEKAHCAIIPAYTEAGPLVGIDAMAAGKIILSTRVGAMPERLQNSMNDFWFDAGEKEEFKEQFERIKNMNPYEVSFVASQNRSIYLKNYNKDLIREEYKKGITLALQKNQHVYNSRNSSGS